MNQTLIPHLFRTEFGKIVSVLVRKFGVAHMEAAEDIASETFMTAVETWPYRGIPENPVAWLYKVAGNKARNFVHREGVFRDKVASNLVTEPVAHENSMIDLSAPFIQDSQLQMLFAVCHPSISAEAQIGLALRILCGFGIDEIASAFLSNKETISKRLQRAKEQLRRTQAAIEIPGDGDLQTRLDPVLTTLYLLFSEGYYSENNEKVLREELCHEAMRLTALLFENARTNQPKVHALYALMCFHSSRFAARKSGDELVLYADQDEGLWDRQLITQGGYHLQKAARGTSISTYHLEASIAYWHTIKEDSIEKWENILQLYNQLLQLAYSPVAALNRTYALSRARGKQTAIAEASKLNLTDNHLYAMLMGELYTGIDNNKAAENFLSAFKLAATEPERRTIKRKLDLLRQSGS